MLAYSLLSFCVFYANAIFHIRLALILVVHVVHCSPLCYWPLDEAFFILHHFVLQFYASSKLKWLLKSSYCSHVRCTTLRAYSLVYSYVIVRVTHLLVVRYAHALL
jgi:hypothetical protein